MQEKAKEILIIGTYGIDIFHGMVDEMEQRGYLVFTTTSAQIAQEYLQNRKFDAIIINLEPDGKGSVAESGLLNKFIESPLQANAICLGVSAHYPHSLPSDKNEKHLQILAGWLTLPVKANVLADHIVELIDSPHKFTIKEKLTSL
ncbi:MULTISPECIES: hypothetical protein [unclassified Oleiphilus]|jgi:hypothetical protein|uniref:hypothetical protein n=1 Tax=unclassified Oleiphilus TaxID=2631174 RepID=UPI0007C2FCB3|nr:MULTISPECIES: hypothetical protein [unclassified Oleiphilus]KZY40445.1 hypothetical protein A3732_19780 [Oleiphilus sp. HI0050]KZY86851.1 hypothetical protein A3743_15995 [Oleiphilus sp. HI0072]KZZ10462.1 hypothetical protein A3749_11095 [Oleiphilus sp. HI0078]KZZ29920.1 hypothetical protein A3752_18070 [Oleiphilus sp. HI0081]KZY29316.1 hypothetical protein A3729_12385 [Oleiphilus sp. HI0043]